MVLCLVGDVGNDQRKQTHGYYTYLSSYRETSLVKLTRVRMEPSTNVAWRSCIAQHHGGRNGQLEEGKSTCCAFLAMEPRNPELEKPPP